MQISILTYYCKHLIMLVPLILLFCIQSSTGVEYTPEELRAIEKLRNQVKNEIYEDYMSTNEYLINWLRIRYMNVESAKQLLLKSLEWRKANRIDSILSEDTKLFEKTYPVFTGGRDKEGRPVVFLPIGRWDLRKAVITGHADGLRRYFYKIVETEISRLRSLQNVTQFILIVDLNGYTPRQHACLSCLPFHADILVNLELNYPLYTKNAILINTPRVFATILSAMEPLVDRLTRNILLVFDHDKREWQNELFKRIAPEELPVQYGGKKKYDFVLSNL